MSAGGDEFAPAASPDGKTFYFTFRPKGAPRSEQKIYQLPFQELKRRVGHRS